MPSVEADTFCSHPRHHIHTSSTPIPFLTPFRQPASADLPRARGWLLICSYTISPKSNFYCSHRAAITCQSHCISCLRTRSFPSASALFLPHWISCCTRVAMTATRITGNQTARPTRLVPGTTLKRLPWLDGKTSNAVSATPAEDDPSPTTRSSSRNVSVLTVPRRTATASTTAESTVRPSRRETVIRKKLASSPAEQRMLAMPSSLSSSPSPVMRHRMAQSQRESIARQAALCSRSTTHETSKRLSVVDIIEPGVDKEVEYTNRQPGPATEPPREILYVRGNRTAHPARRCHNYGYAGSSISGADVTVSTATRPQRFRTDGEQENQQCS